MPSMTSSVSSQTLRRAEEVTEIQTLQEFPNERPEARRKMERG
jgi:hypothetical protein